MADNIKAWLRGRVPALVFSQEFDSVYCLYPNTEMPGKYLLDHELTKYILSHRAC